MAEQKIKQASEALVRKLVEIEAHPAFKGIWPFLHVHNYNYDGPTWESELKELREALNE